jgi:hypothetical protein
MGEPSLCRLVVLRLLLKLTVADPHAEAREIVAARAMLSECFIKMLGAQGVVRRRRMSSAARANAERVVVVGSGMAPGMVTDPKVIWLPSAIVPM